VSPLFVLLCCASAAMCGALVGFIIGEKRGSNLQRVADIQDLWRAMPDRDSRGRFRRKCGLVCERNKCVDTAANPPML